MSEREPVATSEGLNKIAKALQDLFRVVKPTPCPSSYDAIWREYAAEIRRVVLSASVVTALQEEVSAAEARANAAEQRLREAVKVLEPFASVIEDYDPWKEGDDTQGTLVIGSVTDYRSTLGDLRDARAFIKETGE